MRESIEIESDFEVVLFDPHKTHLHIDEFADLVLREEGKDPVHGVRPTRCFPISSGDRYIALNTHEGKELGLVREVDELDADSQKALRSELSRAYFRPQIQRVHAITEQYHVPRWQVETDRGPRTFEIRSSRRDMRVLSAGRILIRDADGNLYEVPDYRQLDPQSRALVETQV